MTNQSTDIPSDNRVNWLSSIEMNECKLILSDDLLQSRDLLCAAVHFNSFAFYLFGFICFQSAVQAKISYFRQ